VQHRVDPSGDVDELGDVLVEEMEVGAPGEVLDVAQVARDQVVHAHHFPAFAEEAVAQVTAEEPGATGDHDALFLVAHAWSQRL
jgi:hypothetical protein